MILMPNIDIHGTEYFYSEADVIRFDEGLIGLPNFNRAALVALPDYAPFCWLAALDDSNTRFLVVNPHEVFDRFEPPTPADVNSRLDLQKQDSLILSIVKISSDWNKTTINLRAPIFINPISKHGAQAILSETNYKLDESLPQEISQEAA